MKKIKVSEAIDKLPLLAETLRRFGVKVGTGQIVEGARILQDYAGLKRTDFLDIEDVSFVLSGAFALSDSEEDVLNNILENMLFYRSQEDVLKNIIDEIEKELNALKLKPGQKVYKKSIFRNERGRKERIRAYLKLKGAGIIQGDPGNERVVSWQRILGISRLLAKKGFTTLDEYLSASKRLNGEDLVLRAESGIDLSNEELLKGLGNRRLVKLGKIALRKNDRRLLTAVAEEMSRRLLSGSLPGDNNVMKILRKAGISTSEHLRRVASREPEVLASSELSLKEKLEIVRSLPEEKAAEAIAKLIKSLKDEEEIDKVVSEVNPALLWAVKSNPYRGEKAELFSAAVEAAESLRESLIYATTNEEGRADMALYLAERSIKRCERLDDVKINDLNTNTIKAIAILAMDIVNLLRAKGEDYRSYLNSILIKLPITQGITLLRSLYRKTDPSMRRHLIQLATNYLYRFSSREGLRLLPRKVKGLVAPGRIDVKDTTFRMIRMVDNPLVYIKKLKSKSVSLALDLSGSMLEYSMWAISIAMLFARNIEKLTLFSHEVKSIKGPFSRSDLAELLLSLEFKGYTDVYNAIVETCSGTGSKKVVFVSDIKQTVESGDPVEAIKNYCRGSRVLFIVPPSYDSSLAVRLKLVGAKLIVAYKPRDVAREVLRSLMR